MKIRMCRTGLISKLLLLLVGLVVVAGVIAYFASDIWRTRINAAHDQFSRWTPENIAKDPLNYLNFCEEESKTALQDLKASEISVRQGHEKLQNMKDEANNKISVGAKALDDLKAAYTRASADNTWPVAWQGQNREKDWTQRQIVSLNRQVEAQKSMLTKLDGGIKKLDNQLDKILDGRAKVQEQLSEISTSREMLKVQKITDEMTGRLAGIKGVLQSTISTASENSSVMSLDQIAADSVGTVDQGEFDKIMGPVKK